MTIITYILNYIKCKNGKGDCNYLIYSFVSDFEDYFENIFNNLSTRRRQREIDLKSEDIFLNVNSICDEIIAKQVLLVPKKIFPRLHK